MIDEEEDKPSKLFTFQRLNKYFFLPFFVPIICFSTKFFSETMKTDNGKKNLKDISSDEIHTFVFLYQIIQSICFIIGGLLYFINAYKSRTRLRNDSLILESLDIEARITSDDISIDTKKTKGKGSFTYKLKYCRNFVIIILMPLLFICYNMGIAYGVKHPQLEKRIYFLFFITLINIIIFKKQIYSHQKLSLVITAIGIVPIFIAFWVYLNYQEYEFAYDIFLFIGSFCYSLYLVFIKYITLNKGMSVFLLLLFQGFLSFIYTIIIYCIISMSVKGDMTYLSNIFNCNESNFVCISHFYFNIIMYVILNTVLQTLIFLVVYHFSPELFAISDIPSPLFSFIALCIEIGETKVIKIILTVLGYLIIFLASLIYNELIVCNFCGFNENTWSAIDKKANDEALGKNDGRDSFRYNADYKVECITIKDGDDEEDKVEMHNI